MSGRRNFCLWSIMGALQDYPYKFFCYTGKEAKTPPLMAYAGID